MLRELLHIIGVKMIYFFDGFDSYENEDTDMNEKAVIVRSFPDFIMETVEAFAPDHPDLEDVRIECGTKKSFNMFCADKWMEVLVGEVTYRIEVRRLV